MFFSLCAFRWRLAIYLQFAQSALQQHKVYAPTPTQSGGDQAANADLFESPRETWKATVRRAFLINDVVVGGGGTQSIHFFSAFFAGLGFVSFVFNWNGCRIIWAFVATRAPKAEPADEQSTVCGRFCPFSAALLIRRVDRTKAPKPGESDCLMFGSSAKAESAI